MKTKLFSLILCTALVLTALSLASCGEEKSPAPAADTAADTAAIETAATEAAPVETEPVTQAPETEPPVRNRYDEIALSNKEGTRNPLSLVAKNACLATHFKVDEGFVDEITVSCPSWNDNLGSLTFKLFAWNTDYATTIAAEPLYSETFVDYDDNTDLTISFKTEDSLGAAAGEYLFWVGDGVDEGKSGGIGTWSYGFNTDDERIIENFKNGRNFTNFGMDGTISIVIPG